MANVIGNTKPATPINWASSGLLGPLASVASGAMQCRQALASKPTPPDYSGSMNNKSVGVLAPKVATSKIGTNTGVIKHATSPVLNAGGLTTEQAKARDATANSSMKFLPGSGRLNPSYKDPNAPTTPVKSITNNNVDGSSTTTAYHPPAIDNTTKTQEPAPVRNTVGSQIQNVANTGQQTGNEQQTYKGLLNQSQNSSQEYKDAQAEAKRIQDESGQYAKDYAEKTNNIAGTAGFLTQQSGLQGQLNNQYNTVQGNLAQQYQGATNRLGAANTQQGLQVQAGTNAGNMAQTQAQRATGAQTSVLGAVAPQYGVQYGTQVGQPGLSNGGINTQDYGGILAQTNIKSANDAQSELLKISKNSPIITTNLTRAIDLASQAKLDPNSPLLTGIQHAFSNGLITNQGLTAFNSVIDSLNEALAEVGEAPIDLNTATPNAIAQLAQTIPNNLQVKNNTYSKFISDFSKTGSNSSSSTNTTKDTSSWTTYGG